MATLNNLNLVNRSRGFTPSQRLIQLYKLIEDDSKLILDKVEVLISKRGKRGNRGNGQSVLP
jgi:hypothetical protein